MILRPWRNPRRAKTVRKIGLSAICGERKQMPRFDVSRWNYNNSIEPMEGCLLLGVQEVPSSNLGSPTKFLKELQTSDL